MSASYLKHIPDWVYRDIGSCGILTPAGVNVAASHPRVYRKSSMDNWLLLIIGAGRSQSNTAIKAMN